MTRLFHSALLTLFGFLLAGWVLLVSMPPRGNPVTLKPAPDPPPLVVHVAGAVVDPGVYELPRGARVRDAIAAAGGTIPGDPIREINLARELVDGEQVLVSLPAADTNAEPGAAASESGLVNINTAARGELETLPGIGPSIAQRIIDYREENGPFAQPSEIVRVSGIGPSIYEKIKNRITTGP